jgi:chromosome segregation ATPase
MPTFKTENLSDFGRLALGLDHDFAELERLSGQLIRLELESDVGLERSVKLLHEFAERGQSIAQGVQVFGQALEEARGRAEGAAKLVAERATQIQRRKIELEQIQEKFGQLGAKVQAANAELAAMKNLTGADPSSVSASSDEQVRIPEQLRRIDAQLEGFLNEAQAIREEAKNASMRTVERNAESLFGTLQSVRRKLGQVIPATH